MKLLIIGCSHSVGVFDTNRNFNVNDGWVNLIAKKYNNYNIECYSHLGGGCFNYLTTLGLLEDTINNFDKVIVQYTTEPRLAFYDLKSFTNLPKDLYVSTDFSNLNRFFYNHNKMSGGTDVKTGNLYIQHTKCYNNLIENDYMNLTIDSYKSLINQIFKNKIYTFEWSNIKNKINETYGKNTYQKIVNSVDGDHLDSYGNKLVFELIEPDLDNFL